MDAVERLTVISKGSGSRRRGCLLDVYGTLIESSDAHARSSHDILTVRDYADFSLEGR